MKNNQDGLTSNFVAAISLCDNGYQIKPSLVFSDLK